jgi:hypothetical protein
MGHLGQIKKSDNDLQIVWGEVYVPGFPDSQGDFMTAEEVREMAYNFAKSGNMGSIDVNHDHGTYAAHVVETFIAREDDPLYIPGSWVAGVHIEDPELWKRVKSGELNGFSFEGLAVREKVEVDTGAMPNVISGVTYDASAGILHKHAYWVDLDDEGNIVGGGTDTVNGHSHKIVRGTVTEDEQGHAHRFSFLDGLLRVA